MNIGVLPFLNSNSINQSQKPGKVNQSLSGFKSAFDAVLNQKESLDPSSGESENLLNDILSLLKNGYMEQVNDYGLLNESKLTEEILSDSLGLTKDEWKEQFSELIDGLFALIGNNPLHLGQQNKVNQLMSEGQYIQGIGEMISIITAIPKDSLKQLKPELFQFAANTANVTASNAEQMDLSIADLKNLADLKENIQDLITKLEQLTNGIQNKNGILQNAFNKWEVNQNGKVLNAEGNRKQQIQETFNQSVQAQQISKIEQFVLHVSKDSKTVDYQQFVKDFTNILGKSQFIKANGANKLLIKLYPEHLGSIRIEVLQDKGMLTARMLASSGAAKEILDSQIHQLKNAFTQQNIQVDKIDVIYGEAEAQKFDRGQSEEQSFNQDQQQKDKHEKEKENSVQFLDVLNDHLLEEKI
ncbi:flagellar hook-length control protein FliK [Heyndrickxia sp. NPDC080065]|uniref:flagellar hook-length control protein FliK n=1 Tax=Heyndrickxia sp. NPDC080065 TaxID=3390568 RepID=UPI003D00F59F